MPDIDEVPVATLRELAARPGTVLVGQLVGDVGSWTVRVVEPAEITSDQCPIYAEHWGPADEHGLDEAAKLDSRTPLYDAEAVDALVASLPGRGHRANVAMP